MGPVVYKSFRDVARLVQQDGRTITAEAVEYPATAAPEDGGILGWAGFIRSVDGGAAALAAQYTVFVPQCPATEVLLAGYSQGAMVVHRNPHTLDASPNLTAALLIADGDRLRWDPTINRGPVVSVPGAGKGVAQDWPILAHAPDPLPVSMGPGRSVCATSVTRCATTTPTPRMRSVRRTAARPTPSGARDAAGNRFDHRRRVHRQAQGDHRGYLKNAGI